MEELIQRILRIDDEKVINFLEATQDFNILHRQEKIIPGIYLVASLSNVLDYIAPESFYKEGGFSFKASAKFPCEVKQIVNVTERKRKEVEIEIKVEKDGKELMHGRVRYSRAENFEKAGEKSGRIRRAEISQEALQKFNDGINGKEDDTSIKNFLLSLVPGALVNSFDGNGGIYCKQYVSFEHSLCSDIKGKNIEVAIERLNKKRISKFRTLGILENYIVFDGYALAAMPESIDQKS